MSAAAQLWRQIVSRVEAAPSLISSSPATFVNSVAKPEFSLIHQLFFPSATQRRASVLLVTTGTQSRATGMCEQLAMALANLTGEKIAVVEAGDRGSFMGTPKQPPLSIKPAEGTGSVHKIPFEFITSGRGELKQARSEFGYFLLCASMADAEMPMFCNFCDAAVLMITANVTRREAARRAQEQLIRAGVAVVGTVLDERKLPIPDWIYRRL